MARKSKITPKQSFKANPGLGWLFHNKDLQQVASIWEGNLTLPSGQEARVQAIAINDPKDRHYDIKIMSVDGNTAKYGPKWTVLDNVRMEPFGTKNANTVNTKIGRVRFWRQLAKPNVEACIRMRFMRDDKGTYVGPSPM